MLIIYNGDPLLIRAEALAYCNNAENLDSTENNINTIRNTAGVGNFSSDFTGGQTDVIDEMVNLRRYELFFEGHRWLIYIDMTDSMNCPLTDHMIYVWLSLPS